MGWSASTMAKMAKRYGHIGSDVQRAALDALAEAPRLGSQAAQSKLVQAHDSHPNS